MIVIYATLSVGIGVSSHHCMGEISSTNVFSFESERCACESNTNSVSDCCDDEVNLFTLEDNHQQTAASNISSPNYYLLYTFKFITEVNTSFTTEDEGQLFHRPPSKVDALYKINCSYTFYG